MKSPIWLSLNVTLLIVMVSADLTADIEKKLTWLQDLQPISPAGRTLYVDMEHSRADDGNSGTADAPWKTLGHAVNQLKGGDTLLVAEGIYRENIEMNTSGDPGNPIRIKGVDRKNVVISGAVQINQWRSIDKDTPEFASTIRPDSQIELKAWQPHAIPIVKTSVKELLDKTDCKHESKEGHFALFVCGNYLVQMFELDDLQQGTWFVDNKSQILYLWPPESKDVRQLKVELAPVRHVVGENATKIYSADFPGRPMPPDKGMEKRFHKRGMLFTNQLFVEDKRLVRVFEFKNLQPNTWFLNEADNTVNLCLQKEININNLMIELAVLPSLFKIASGNTDIIIQNITFTRAANVRKHPAVHFYGNSRVVLEHCDLHWCKAVALRFDSGENFVIRDCRITHNGQIGVLSGKAKDSLIEECELSYNTWAYNFGWETGGSKFVFSKNLIVRRTVAAYNQGPGIWYDIDNEGGIIYQCVAHDNTHSGIFYEISFDGEIYDCLVFNNYHWEPDDLSGGAAWGNGIATRGSPRAKIHHNLVVNNRVGICTMGWGVRRGHPEEQKRGWISKENKFYNNIMVDNQLVDLGLFNSSDEAERPSLSKWCNNSQYNVYGLSDKQKFKSFKIIWGGGYREFLSGTKFHDITEFRKVYADQAIGSVEKKIEFMDPDHGDWRIDPEKSDYLSFNAGPQKEYKVGRFIYGGL